MTSYSEILKSGPFAFHFPSENVTITTHRALFANHSPPLHNMVNNWNLKEGKEGQAVLEEVDSATFVRAVQWVYTGNYVVEIQSSSPAKDNKGSGGGGTGSSIFRSSATTTNEQMHQLLHLTDATKPPAATTEQEIPYNLNRFASKRFHSGDNLHRSLSAFLKTDVILAQESFQGGGSPCTNLIDHAKVYVFADTYLIDDLKGFVLHKLHAALLTFPLHTHPRAITALTDLLTYIFTHGTMEMVNGLQPAPPPPPTALYISRAASADVIRECFPLEDVAKITHIRPVGQHGHWQVSFASAEDAQAVLDRQPARRKSTSKGYDGPLMKFWEDKPGRDRKVSPTSTSARNAFAALAALDEVDAPASIIQGNRFRSLVRSDPVTSRPPKHVGPYTANDEDIRDLVVDYAVAWKRELAEREEFMAFLAAQPEAMKAIFRRSVGGGGVRDREKGRRREGRVEGVGVTWLYE